MAPQLGPIEGLPARCMVGRGTVTFLALSIVAVGAYSSVAMPLLAVSVEEHFGLLPGALGGLLSVGFIGGVAGGLLAGYASDHWGHLRTLRLLALTAAAGAVACGVARSLAPLAVGLVVLGFGYSGAMVACGGLLAALYPSRKRGSFSALMVTSAGAGIVLPYAVVMLEARYAAGTVSFASLLGIPYLCVAGILALASLALYRAPAANAGSHSGPQAAAASGRLGRADLAAIAVVLGLVTIHGTSDGVLYQWITRYLKSTFTDPTFEAGWVLSFYSAAYLAGRLVLTFLPERFGRRALLVVPGIVGGTLALVALHAPTMRSAALAYAVGSLFYGLEFPALMGLAAQRFPTRFATVFGLVSGTNLIAAAGVWSAGKWTEAVGSMRPALSTAACGFVAFGLLAALWLAVDRTGGHELPERLEEEETNGGRAGAEHGASGAVYR